MRSEASIKLQDLRYVVALADHSHFGRAAEACDVSQPTLSGQIMKLEQQLGVTLFERSTKSVRVTDIGAEIADRARQVLADIEAIVSVGQRMAEPLTGTLSLGVIPTLGPYLLPWLVPALKKDFPDLRLAVREDLTAPLLERLDSHRLDAALVALPVPNERLESLPLFDEPFWFAEPKGGETGTAGTVTKDDLRGQRLLLLTEGHCLRDQALAVCQMADPRRDDRDDPLRRPGGGSQRRLSRHARSGWGARAQSSPPSRARLTRASASAFRARGTVSIDQSVSWSSRAIAAACSSISAGCRTR